MTKSWTGELIGKMHVHHITSRTLAKHMGISYQYVSMVLNSKREPPDAENRFRRALDELISLQDHHNTPDVL
ncbi:helix-turn-helix domain-containing protein [Intestinibacillus massiliensis]|uniref:helix-turn-helix domain-containing protein n=1 Tax=Intestinibacillus massiliensis TaxID=1871029 RepID=UPI00117BD72B|nr:helix-turn-helix transcriptional regulator [Intestinibacillus massiliensis]